MGFACLHLSHAGDSLPAATLRPGRGNQVELSRPHEKPLCGAVGRNLDHEPVDFNAVTAGSACVLEGSYKADSPLNLHIGRAK